MARIREIVSAKKSGTFSYKPKESGKTEYAKKHPKAYEKYEKAVDAFASASKTKAQVKAIKAKMGKKKSLLEKTDKTDKRMVRNFGTDYA